ncbi:MAG: hypothetical protein JWO33_1321 [Caulobacteraceae bacterium]|nr:hypothetical protein [Caulobacteraceae bacterium]
MSTQAEAAAQRNEALAEITQICLRAARATEARLMAAESDSAHAELALALQRLARAVRQTVFLGARLEIEAGKAVADGRRQAERDADRQVERRRAQVEALVTRAVYAEVEGDRAEVLTQALEQLLDEEKVLDGFTDEDLDAQVVRLAGDLGLGIAPLDTTGEGAARTAPQANIIPAPDAYSDGAVEACFAPPRAAWNSS